jgi:hypothetical protein
MSTYGPYDLVAQIGDIVQLPSTLPVHVRPGQTVPFFLSVYMLGVLAVPTTVTFSVTDQWGNVTNGAVTGDGLGDFTASIPIPLTANPGVWVATWETSGQAYEGATNQTAFYVDALMVLPVPSGCPPTT